MFTWSVQDGVLATVAIALSSSALDAISFCWPLVLLLSQTAGSCTLSFHFTSIGALFHWLCAVMCKQHRILPSISSPDKNCAPQILQKEWASLSMGSVYSHTLPSVSVCPFSLVLLACPSANIICQFSTKTNWRNLMSNKPTYEITILFLCYNLPSSSMILMFHVFCCLVSNLKSNLNSNKNWGQIFMWWCCNIRIFVSNKTAFEILMLFGATHMCVDVLNWQFEKWCSKPNQAIPVCKQSLDCLFRKKLWFQGTYHKSQSTICIIHALLKNTHVHTH